jgi:hypothetical protein
LASSFVTANLCAKTFSTRSSGPKSCDCSRILPQLIQSEIARRLAAARKADPTKRREDALRRELVRINKSIDRLLTAYQEGLLSLDELRERMPELRRREHADNTELQTIVDQLVDRQAYLRLAETLTTFLTRLRSSSATLDVIERQRVLRLLVKDILVGDDKIIIQHLYEGFACQEIFSCSIFLPFQEAHASAVLH